VTLSAAGTLVLLVENAAGYANLCRLISTRVEHEDGVTLDDVARYSAGLLCLVSSADEAFLLRLREMFDTRLALEVSPHTSEDLRHARSVARLARRHRSTWRPRGCGLPLAGRALRYDILASMRTLTLSASRFRELGAGTTTYSRAEMERHFAELPQALANHAASPNAAGSIPTGDILFPIQNLPMSSARRSLRTMAHSGVERRFAHLATAASLTRLKA
jgi:DNA polymerase III alpha subunit